MPKSNRTGRFVGVAALAASTAISGPIAAYAQNAATIRLAQAEELLPQEAAPAPEAPAPEEAAPAEQAAPVEEPAAEPTPAPVEEPPAAPEPAPEAPPQEAPPEPEQAAEEPAPEPVAEEPAVEEPAVEEPAPAEAETPVEAPAEAAPQEEAPAPEPEVSDPAAEAPVEEPAAEAPADAVVEEPDASDAEPPAETAPEETAPATPAEPAPEAAPADPAAEAQPDTADDAAESDTLEGAAEPETGADAAPTDAEPGEPAEAAAPAEETPADAAAEQPADEAAAEAELAAPESQPEAVDETMQTEAVPEGGVAASDARVQQLAEPVEMTPITAEEGERIEAPAAAGSTTNNNTVINNTTTTNNTVVNNNTVNQQAPLPPGVEVVDRVGNRDILAIVGAGAAGALAGGAAAYFLRGNDDDRIAVDAQERYYDRLGGDRTRETVVRPNGVQVVTITNRYGDVVRRSRIMPDGEEVVLFYDPYQEDVGQDDYYYSDVGAELPPLDLRIPREDYIVDVADPDEDLYYRTIVAPPVETVDRIYSLNEVRRSERIRDKVRRIDLSTINFDFGSADISQEEVSDLQALADAIARVINENPDETFLIEGHTDAVGSERANLALSDERADAVATALTEYFEVPPENLVTQGYGESDLKVDTEAENRENRRVTVRRITPLVKPINTAQR
ncbi:OmpA family protein [Aurantimonas sp. A2-1-M11]|uniref:OmpA family protein n=1 Tax=Aurantimonas sp. A2-1-M11 TaxID=3113712 RepID=UPI002F92D193